MGLAEAPIVQHVALVLLLLCIFVSLGWSHPLVFFLSLLYLYQVNERCSVRLKRRIQYEERKYINQKRLHADSESVLWLNKVVEKLWPQCMEQIASQHLLLPIIPWFLDKYKPWTAKKAVVQHLHLGRNPPTFTQIRVLQELAGDVDLVLELEMKFLSAEDMKAVLAVQLRKRLGLGMWAKMHVTGMHVEGKVQVGVKFIPVWPFLGRVTVCFVEPPYFEMTVKPIFHHGVDVFDLPGIAGWLDKLLAVAFGQTLVEPNMLVVDVEKFASATTESWFTIDEKRPIAFAKVEILEGADLKPSDRNGLADPYVKGQLGPYRFRTKTQKKTLAPKWHEEFKIPISSWEAPNVLVIQAFDKDQISSDDTLGHCSINISKLRGAQRHDKWLTLQNIEIGRLHLAITVLEAETDENSNKGRSSNDGNPSKMTETTNLESNTMDRDSLDNEASSGTLKASDGGQETQLFDEDRDCPESPMSVASTSSDATNDKDESMDGSNIHHHGTIRRGLHKIGAKFHKGSKNESSKQQGDKEKMSVQFAVDDSHSKSTEDERLDQGSCSSEKGDEERTRSDHLREKTKDILKHVGKSASNLKGVLKRKNSDK